MSLREQTSASQLIGALLNYCLYGVLGVQIYVYRISFPDDKRVIKALVYFVLLLQTAETGLIAADLYYWFVTGFGDMLRFADPHYSWIHTPVMGSIMALIVQLFFCYRIWIINKSSLWWCIVIAVVSVTQASGGIAGGIMGHISTNVAKRFEGTVVVYLWLTGDALADISIAATMTFMLMRSRHDLHRQTNDMVRRIVRLVVETNTLSSGIAILSLVLFFGDSSETIFLCPTMIMGKIYANTLLVTFNNRAYVQKGRSQDLSFVISQSARSVSDGLTFAAPPSDATMTALSLTDRISSARGNEMKLHDIEANTKETIHI